MKGIEDLSSEQLEQAEEKYIDELELVIKNFESSAKFHHPHMDDALNSAVDQAPDAVKEVVTPLDPLYEGMIKSYSGMVNSINQHLFKYDLRDSMTQDLKDDLEHMTSLVFLANNMRTDIGSCLKEHMANTDERLTSDQIRDKAHDLLVEVMAYEDDPDTIKKKDIPQEIKANGRKAVTYGLAMLKGTPGFETFQEHGKNFKTTVENLNEPSEILSP